MRILFVSIPAEGHVRPLLPLARATIEAGHDVCFATGTEGVGIVGAAGIDVIEVGPSLGEARSETIRRFAKTRDGAPGGGVSLGREGWRFGQLMFAKVFAPSMTADLLSAPKVGTPDLIVHEFAALAGAIFGRLRGVASVTHGYGVLRPVEALDFVDAASEDTW